jgi:IclR family acetate operon transcriptional repressor
MEQAKQVYRLAEQTDDKLTDLQQRSGNHDVEAPSARAVERVAKILLTFADNASDLGITEIARRVELPKSTVHRMLDGLVRGGLVDHDKVGGRYRLGPRATQLGLLALRVPDIRAVAQPFMKELWEETQETITLSMLLGYERSYLSQIESPYTVRMSVAIGGRFPLYAGASGRTILAQFPPAELDHYFESVNLDPLTTHTIVEPQKLREVLAADRNRGYSYSVGERDVAAAAVAVALIGSDDRAYGALSICGPVSRFEPSSIMQYGERLVRVAANDRLHEFRPH